MGLKNLVSQLDLIGGSGPVSDMGSQTPTQFNLGSTSTLQPDSLTNTYNSSVHNGVSYGPAQLDMDGQPGPQFDLGKTSTLQPDSLGDVPTSSPYQDLDGQPGPSFNFGSNSTLQEDSLTNIYNSSVHSGVSYGPAQLDMDGVTPPQYLDHLPD